MRLGLKGSLHLPPKVSPFGEGINAISGEILESIPQSAALGAFLLLGCELVNGRLSVSLAGTQDDGGKRGMLE